MTVGQVIAFIKMLRVLVLACAPIETATTLACNDALGRSQNPPSGFSEILARGIKTGLKNEQ